MTPERFLEGRLKGHLLPKIWYHLEELTVAQEEFHAASSGFPYTTEVEFVEKSLVRYFVESLGKVQEIDIKLALLSHVSCYFLYGC